MSVSIFTALPSTSHCTLLWMVCNAKRVNFQTVPRTHWNVAWWFWVVIVPAFASTIVSVPPASNPRSRPAMHRCGECWLSWYNYDNIYIYGVLICVVKLFLALLREVVVCLFSTVNCQRCLLLFPSLQGSLITSGRVWWDVITIHHHNDLPDVIPGLTSFDLPRAPCGPCCEFRVSLLDCWLLSSTNCRQVDIPVAIWYIWYEPGKSIPVVVSIVYSVVRRIVPPVYQVCISKTIAPHGNIVTEDVNMGSNRMVQ